MAGRLDDGPAQALPVMLTQLRSKQCSAGQSLLGPQAFLKLQRAGQHHIVAPFGKPCIEGCVGHTGRQPIHVAPLRLEEPWQLADIVAHRSLHGSYGIFLLGFQIF
jgi:hypothetical protein